LHDSSLFFSALSSIPSTRRTGPELNVLALVAAIIVAVAVAVGDGEPSGHDERGSESGCE
jgi:hypothetical protein